MDRWIEYFDIPTIKIPYAHGTERTINNNHTKNLLERILPISIVRISLSVHNQVHIDHIHNGFRHPMILVELRINK